MILPVIAITSASIIIIKNISKSFQKNGKVITFSFNRFLRQNKFPLRMKGFENPMTIMEAYKILNLPPIASLSRVRESHRQLMLRNHPDNGGSNYIASKVNEAKELICGENK